MFGVSPWRPATRHPGGSRAGVIPVAVAIAALLAGCAGPAPTHTLPPLTPVPSVTPGVQPSASPVAWAKLELPDLPEVARLEPTKAGAGGVAVDTAFRLTSLDGRAPATLAARLVSNPPLVLQVASVEGSTALLRPAAPLRASTVYRFSLERPDGSVEAAWAAQAAGPLHVVGTVPDNTAQGVIVWTGIEISFDQAGVTAGDFEDFFSIVPAVKGRFEAAGRTVAFVPTNGLASATLYTVTVRHGLPLAGTGQVLGTDAVIRFETSGRDDKFSVRFREALADASPTELATVQLEIMDMTNESKWPPELPVTIHRLPGLDAAELAYSKVRAAPEWAHHSSVPAVSTAGLALVLSGDLPVHQSDRYGYVWWIQVPRALEAGWYVVTESYAGSPHQLVLQVTDLATFAIVATDRTAVWVNDLASTQPVVGATVSLAGRRLGTTDASGLVVGPTALAGGQPLGSIDPDGPVAGTAGVGGRFAPAATGGGVFSDSSSGIEINVVVRSGTQGAFRPVGLGGICAYCVNNVDTDRWWHLFATDRQIYRPTDTVNAWGVVRNRDTGAIPGTLTVRLVASSDDPGAMPAIATVTASPDATGSYTVRLPFTDLPAGDYRAQATAGSELVGDQYFTVGTIVKPAWSMELTTDRHAVVTGGNVTAHLAAAFFEGTRVVGMGIRLAGEAVAEKVVSTDIDGAATAELTVVFPPDYPNQWTVTSLSANPVLPEEANISDEANVAVFRATALVDAEATVTGNTVTVTGKVSDLDLSRFEAPDIKYLWSVDPRGAGQAGATVQVRVVEHRSVRRQVGTEYDFVTKRVTPKYEFTERITTVGTTTARAGADGTWRLAVPVAASTDPRSFEVLATFTDAGGRATTGTAWASDGAQDAYPMASLRYDDPGNTDGTYSVGDAVRVRFEGRVADPVVERYLYAVMRIGLRDVVTSDVPTFQATFDASLVPSFGISAVRFNGTGYEWAMWGAGPRLRLDDRRVTVEVTPDQARYAPGATASVGIRTLGPDGKPVSASVHVLVVDEKLYAIGAAYELDPLSVLYENVGTGLLGWAASHRTIGDEWYGGMGATGGSGGERSDFRDWLLATLVTTGSDGRARVTVPLSDDLTSWRVTAGAVDRALEAGSGRAWLQVGLPFFVEATIAAEYLASDQPSIIVRAFGASLAAGERVRFTVSSDTLPMAVTTAEAAAFTATGITLPALSVGTHRLRIEATAGAGSTLRSDALIRTFKVVATRTTQARTTWAPLDAVMTLRTGTAMTSMTLVEAGRGRVVPVLDELAITDGARADRAIAAALANRVLVDRFGLPARAGWAADDLARFLRDGWIAVVPYGSGDLDTTVLAAMAGDPRLDAGRTATVLGATFESTSDPRDRRLLALAGLAALGRPVLPEVQAAAAMPDLSVPEQVSIALAALFAGDEALALRLERALLAEHGVRSGPWVRIDGGAASNPAVDTARLAIVAASLGDPIAADMDAWIAANPPRTTTVDLERALAARGWATRVAGADAVAALTVDGVRRDITVSPGAPVALELTPAQAASAILLPVSGKILVITSWTGPLDPTSLAQTKGQGLSRTVSPGPTIGATDTVTVTVQVKVDPKAAPGCWRVTDLVPSGLAPISPYHAWDYDPATVGSFMPDRVTGQRVEWCVGYDPKRSVQQLRYVARVVTPGTYTWEPAVLQSEMLPDIGMALEPTTVTIRGLGG